MAARGWSFGPERRGVPAFSVPVGAKHRAPPCVFGARTRSIAVVAPLTSAGPAEAPRGETAPAFPPHAESRAVRIPQMSDDDVAVSANNLGWARANRARRRGERATAPANGFANLPRRTCVETNLANPSRACFTQARVSANIAPLAADGTEERGVQDGC